MADASTTSTTGASRRRATSAVDEAVPSLAPSKRPMTPFHHEQSAPAAGPGRQGGDGVGAAQPGVEVAGRAAGGQGVIAGIDEVGADLGRGRAVAGPAQGGDQPGRHGRLAHPGVGAGDDQAGTEGGAGHADQAASPVRSRASRLPWSGDGAARWHPDPGPASASPGATGPGRASRGPVAGRPRLACAFAATSRCGPWRPGRAALPGWRSRSATWR